LQTAVSQAGAATAWAGAAMAQPRLGLVPPWPKAGAATARAGSAMAQAGAATARAGAAMAYSNGGPGLVGLEEYKSSYNP